MKKLFLDIGNSRIKWAQTTKSGYEFIGVETLDDVVNSIDELFFDSVSQPDAVYYTAVGCAKKIDEIKSAIQSVWQLIPIQLSSQKSCCGLESGYDDFHLLGADRWMAMQGALSHTSDPFVVIDLGTAITVDPVMEGKHLGGFIVPGLTSLRCALSKDTADLNLFLEPSADNATEQSSLLPTTTEMAILAGTMYMCASFLNQVIADLNSQLKTELKVFLTGGDAKQFKHLIDAKTFVEEDLVLQGMVSVVESIKQRK